MIYPTVKPPTALKGAQHGRGVPFTKSDQHDL